MVADVISTSTERVEKSQRDSKDRRLLDFTAQLRLSWRMLSDRFVFDGRHSRVAAYTRTNTTWDHIGSSKTYI